MLSADFIRHPPPCLNLFATALVSSCHFPIKECFYWLHCLALNSRLKIVNKLFSHVLMHAIIMALEFVCQTKSQSLLATLPCLKLQALQSDQPIQNKIWYSNVSAIKIANKLCLSPHIRHLSFKISPFNSVLCRILFVRHFERIPIISTLHYTTIIDFFE